MEHGARPRVTPGQENTPLSLELNELGALIAVVEHGSVQLGAKHVGVPRTTLSRRLASLEAQAGLPLLVRDGKALIPTPTGRLLIERGRTLLGEAARLEADVLRSAAALTGRITVLLSVGVHPLASAMVLLSTRAQLPELQVHIRVLEDPLACLATEGDVAVVISHAPLEGPWLARRVATVPVRLLATRDYLAAAGTPTTLRDLHDHPLFVWSLSGGDGRSLPLLAGGTFAVKPALSSTDPVIGWEAARAGAGICFAPNARIPNDGWPAADVVVLLPELLGCDIPVWLVAPAALSARPGLRALIETLTAFLSEAV